MNNEFQTLFAASLNWLTVFVCASLIGCALYGMFRRVTMVTPAHNRGSYLLIYALLPALVATAVSTTLYFPAVAHLFLPAHCHGGDCAPHAPLFAVNMAYAATTAAATLVALGMLFYLPLRQLLRHRRNAEVIERLSASGRQAPADRQFHIVENDTALAWCDGLLWPRVFVSRGLLDRVDARELQIVLAHEQAHAQRRDNMSRLLIDWATRLWPAPRRRELRDDFTSAAEQACDHMAARVGKPDDVARLIERLGDTHESATVSQRLQALSASSPHPLRSTPLVARLLPALVLLGLCLAQAWLFARAAHPLLEWLG